MLLIVPIFNHETLGSKGHRIQFRLDLICTPLIEICWFHGISQHILDVGKSGFKMNDAEIFSILQSKTLLPPWHFSATDG